MPRHYGSQVDEHHQVRRDAGMFDVAHMTVVDLHGACTREFLRRLLANNIDKLQKPGKALYSAMLDDKGGVIDDLNVYYLGEEFFRLVVNAAPRAKRSEEQTSELQSLMRIPHAVLCYKKSNPIQNLAACQQPEVRHTSATPT